jgi:hypothetical protein
MKPTDADMVDQREKIVSTRARLRACGIDRRASEPSPVVCDDAVAGRSKGRNLVLPYLAAACRGMYEHYRYAGSA